MGRMNKVHRVNAHKKQGKDDQTKTYGAKGNASPL
jgi:hypothetical protein